MNTVNILLPVLNEEKRLKRGLDKLLPFMDNFFLGRYVLTVVDNGSSDKTENIAKDYVAKFNQVKYIKLAERGVGLAFRAGCAENNSDIVGYMDIDLSTDINCLLEVDKFFKNEETDIVNASRLSKGSVVIGRKWYRSVSSYGLKYLLKIVFNMRIDDAICGFKFYRKKCVEKLISGASDLPGWFYCIELIIRAERQGFNIKELPVTWTDDPNSKVNFFKQIKNYIVNIIKLFFVLRKEGKN
ncbi:MAG: glycosyltransferase [Syntrophomonadaceae bacterium]|jgi:glycosyltransferase involved in cell wall biosynthesis|nr:glycosyltransferase [Syntrophomonadaceae bacterium]